MSTAPAAANPLDHLMARLEARDRDGALGLVRELRTRGVTPAELITDLLAPAQRRVGELWQTESWNVAQEHAATSIVDSALADIELSTDVAQIRGSVVVTCAEGEWHALPARMLAQQLRHHGWSVTFLGASTPAPHLARFLDSIEPVAVAVSCSIPIFLLGAQRSIDAAHDRGLPALAGGAGFGINDLRSGVLGADGWAQTPAAADKLLTTWTTQRPELRRPSPNAAALSLAAARNDMVEAALGLLTARFAPVRRYNQSQLDRTKEDLGYILQFVEASLLTGDATVFDEFLPWLELVLTSRGLPGTILEVSVDVLRHVLPHDQPDARSLLDTASAEARRPPDR